MPEIEHSLADYPHEHVPNLVVARDLASHMRSLHPDRTLIILATLTDAETLEYVVADAAAWGAAREEGWSAVETFGEEFPDTTRSLEEAEVGEEFEPNPELREMGAYALLVHDVLREVGLETAGGGSGGDWYHWYDFHSEQDAELFRLLLVLSGAFTLVEVKAWPMRCAERAGYMRDDVAETMEKAAIYQARLDAGLETGIGVPREKVREVYQALRQIQPTAQQLRQDRRWA